MNIAKIVSSVVILIVVGILLIYLISEYKLRQVTYDPAFSTSIPSDPQSIEHGLYIARTRGCFGCHGQQLQGDNFDEQWDWPARAIAPNLSLYAKNQPPEVLEAAIRQGIGANRKALVSMPSYNFARLSDEDTAALIAFLKSAPVIKQNLPLPKLGLRARWDIAVGNELSYAKWANMVPELSIDPNISPVKARGEYLAMTMCNECHGLDLRGYNFADEFAPDLALVAGIDLKEFTRIVRTGRGINERHLGLMTLVAPDRFPTLKQEDIDALHVFLSTLHLEPVKNAYWRQ